MGKVLKMEKLSSSAYVFYIFPKEGGCGLDIDLHQITSGKVKEFYQAVGSIVAMTAHMNSLTDLQCGEWFKVKKEKI